MGTIENFAKNFFANRIGGKNFGEDTKIYKFEKIKRAKREAQSKYPNRILLDMGVGEPDEMADPETINVLFQEAKQFRNRGYADNGCFEFKEAVAKYMASAFNVALDSDGEILHSIGSKAALSILPLCFVNDSDTVITTTPGYPVFGTHSHYLGANVISLPLSRANSYLPELEKLSEETLRKTKIVSLNYPNNPTGATCTREFFKKVIELAHRYEFLIINDAAYADLAFDEADRLSILEIDGAKEVALELHSMSKGFNMTGWRIGWVCGNRYLINTYGNVKDNSDSGQFLPIQKAAARALADNSIAEANGTRYSRRMDVVIALMGECGFKLEKPKAGFFLYGLIPAEAEFNETTIYFSSAEQFAQWMIAELGIVCVPWDDIEPAVRLSMTFTSDILNEQRALELLRERLGTVRFFGTKASGKITSF
ncbi:MAG: aminotransferase class I/II-fold pyridoxal phosphate-dependent enzyme [Puniceicoccales bacterium]|jgi:LL-diaminopimelate aminotransferase|nr:aminotransferase class I/II-fold pyridoxal phosphate-dependent enzyme [Puniceicoccales bacterium]